MARNRLIFLSDIHIGMDAATNWYQSSFHEPMLRAVFDWVIAQAASIAELILLGDVVDLWTYPPAMRPPTFAEVAARQPGIFAPGDGAIARALAALDGAVTYVPGNHDMQVTADDVATIRDHAGHAVRHADTFPYLPAAGGGRVACAHGHQFSMFNAQDWAAMPATGLPVGHVVTRLAALWTTQHLTAGQNAADQPGSAEPTGWIFEKDELTTLLVDVVRSNASLAELTVDALLRATGAPRSLPITLHDGTTLTAEQAIAAYADLFRRFGDRERFPGAAYGLEPAFFALIGADLHNTLDHFARELGRHHKVIVLGHTHSEKDEAQRPMLIGAESVYANCGFNCPSRPDVGRAQHPRRPTFVEVEVDDAARRLTVLVHEVDVTATSAAVRPAPLDTLTVAF